MKTFIAHLLCLIACLPALAATLEDRKDELEDAPGVVRADIATDAQGRAILEPMPGFDGYQIAQIRYLTVVEDVAEDNAVALIVDADGNAVWHRRVPTPLTIARQAAKPLTVGTDEDIRTAINTAQNVTLAAKLSIERADTSADVRGYVETGGKLIPVHYYVAKNIKTGTWIVKPYDVEATAKEALAR